MSYEVDEIKELARNRWPEILVDLAGLDAKTLNNRHHPCPHCGGEDRWRFDDKEGRGAYICSYCGGGDGFALLQKTTGLQFKECLESVGKWLNAPGDQGLPRCQVPAPRREKPASKWVPVYPMTKKFIDQLGQKFVNVWNPKREEEPEYKGSRLRPTLVSIYRNLDNEAIGAVLRYEINGKKNPTQICQARHENGDERLVMMGLPLPKPLLGTEKISGEKAVIVVEGEKTYHAVSSVIDSCDVVTWAGGSSNFKDSDWEVLSGLTVYLCEDNDQPGFAAMNGISDILKKYNAKTFIIKPPPGKRDHWDFADAINEDGWTGSQILEHIESSIHEDSMHVIMESSEKEFQVIPKLSAGDWIITKGNGKPLGTIENFEVMLGYNQIKPRYNLISKQLEVYIPGVTSTVDNMDNVALSHIISLASKNEFPTTNIADYLSAIGDRNAYNPVATWIASKPWDGEDRITKLIETIPTQTPELKSILMVRWLVGAVAVLFCERQTELHGVLVLKGRQGTGKTKWTRALLPDNLSEQYILTGAMLDPASKDSVMGCISNWIVELGELGATMRKADQDRLKAFITNPVDRLRRPYARMESTFQRRTTFIASVNDERFLKDASGDRRYWVIEVDGMIDYSHGLDMQQVWAQALALYRAGTPHWLSREEQDYLEPHNAEHRELCPVKERLTSCLDWDSHPTTWRTITATDLLIELGFNNVTQALVNRCSQALTELGCGYVRRERGRFRIVPEKLAF